MASASAILPKERYDVFISFRGSDTRKTFTSHLHAALIGRKIDTYIDYRLEKGEELEPALLKAIEESKIYVIIFSQDYASSTWCLKELAYMMECESRNEKYVIPVFYDIEPSVVRHHKESYQVAFSKHEERPELMEEVLKWKGAMTKAANRSGFSSTSKIVRDDNDLVEQVVRDVLTKLNREFTRNLTGRFIGIEARIRSIVRALDIIPNDSRARFLVIWGMGGIGKTTLADVVFHGLASQFEACCFIANVRERSGAKGEFSSQLYKLRNELLRQLLGDNDLTMRTPTVDSYVQKRLNRKKILLVLDDVNHLSQLEFLAGDQLPFGPGSRIVVTTRDLQPVRLLRKVTYCDVKTYKVKELNVAESMQFLYSNSLINSTKDSNFLDIVLDYTAGVPLALKVLSPRFLQCKSQEELELLWAKLRKFPDKKLQNVYRVSYEGLERNEREIFLDIAYFHKWEGLWNTKRILAACGLFPDDGIKILTDMSLISLKDDCIWMHDVIQEMAVEIVKEECAENPGNRSRLYNYEDGCHVLKNNMGTANVRSIYLRNFDLNPRKLTLCPQAFTGMHNLRFLKLSFLEYEGEVHLESLPNALRYLSWVRCPLESLPSNFCPENLVELHMRYNRLTRFCYRGQDLKNLKTIDFTGSTALVEVDLSNCVNIEMINLSRCPSLVRLSDLSNCVYIKSIDLSACMTLVEVPDLSNCVNIEMINLSRCPSLVRLSDLSNCVYIKSIDLSDCMTLVEVPDLSNCVNIEMINLSRCPSLVQIPPYIHTKLTHLSLVCHPAAYSSVQLKVLTDLNLDFTEIESVPSSIESLTGIVSLSLMRLDLSRSTSLTNFPDILEPMEHLEYIDLSLTDIQELPSSFRILVGLKTLNLSGCRSFLEIPNCFDSLVSLQILDLTATMIQTIPPTIKQVSGLKSLKVDWCRRLQSLPVLPVLLEELTATGCGSLKTVAASVTSQTQGLNQIIYGMRRELHTFYQCVSLDEEARRNIMDDAYYRIMRMATACNLGHVSSGAVTLICENIEIPKWFSCQTEGSSMNIKLPLHWFESNLLGFVLCIVTGYKGLTHIMNSKYQCKMILKTKDGEGHILFSGAVSYHFEGGMIMWYNDVAAVSDEAKESTEAYFEFNPDSDYEESDNAESDYEESDNVKRCGVCFLYPQGQDDNALKFELIHPQQVSTRRHTYDEASGNQVSGELECNRTEACGDYDTGTFGTEPSGEYDSGRQISGGLESTGTVGTEPYGDYDTASQISGECEFNGTESHYKNKRFRWFRKIKSVLTCHR